MGLIYRFGMITSLLLGFSCTTKTPDPIRVGMNPWPGYEFLYLAQKKGFFQDLGVEVKLVEFTSNGDVRRAYERNQIDVGASTTIDLLTIRLLSNRNPSAFFVCDFSNGADVILARKSVTDITALKGRRVGAEPASLDMMVLTGALETAGLSLQDIDLVSMSQLSMPQSFEDGHIDVAVTYPPNSFAILKRDDAHKIFDTSRIPGTVMDILIADEAYLERREKDLSLVVQAFDRAVQFARQNPDEAHAIMANRENLSLEDFRDALMGMQVITLAGQRPFFTPGGSLAVSLRRTHSVLQAAGMIDENHPRVQAYTSRIIDRAGAP